jgi:hypothetical protein
MGTLCWEGELVADVPIDAWARQRATEYLTVRLAQRQGEGDDELARFLIDLTDEMEASADFMRLFRALAAVLSVIGVEAMQRLATATSRDVGEVWREMAVQIAATPTAEPPPAEPA